MCKYILTSLHPLADLAHDSIDTLQVIRTAPLHHGQANDIDTVLGREFVIFRPGGAEEGQLGVIKAAEEIGCGVVSNNMDIGHYIQYSSEIHRWVIKL